MRLLLDSNVWISAFATRGLCADLVRLVLRHHGDGRVELLTCAAVQGEAVRVLRDRFGASEDALRSVRETLAWARTVGAGAWRAPEAFPDPDDAPIMAAALAASADWFVTGDGALLALARIERTIMVDPRTAYERLRGLS